MEHLNTKYPGEFQAYGLGNRNAPSWDDIACHDGVYFLRGEGLVHFFITINSRSINFFQPRQEGYEINVDAADPELFAYIDKYAKLYLAEV